MIDLYCERTGPEFWSEPFNALTNISFLVAAICSWRLWRRMDGRPVEPAILFSLMTAVGVGSFLFHTFATFWAQLLDVIPILLFQVTFIWVYSRKVIPLGRAGAAGLIILLGVLILVAGQFPHLLNRSLNYAPGALILIFLAVHHYLRRRVERSALLAAAGVFLVALFFRTIDELVCESFPRGTHFLWHLLNGLVVYLVFRALALNGWRNAVPSE